MSMMVDWTKTDALIFDMDGTLWDAVDSYCKIWDVCFGHFGCDRRVGRDELIGCMGLTPDKIYDRIISGKKLPVEKAEFLEKLDSLEKELMPVLGGKPYPGVREGIEQLSEKYVLFLVSNCSENGLTDMMRFLDITRFVKESVTFGATHRTKDANMVYLKSKYGLENPVYIGDTEGDCTYTRKAGMPFVHAAYGFGECENPDLRVASFEELTAFFLKQKNY